MGWLSDAKDYIKQNKKEANHLLLDLLGLIPVLGAFADLYNGAVYAWEEDPLNAAFSGIAALPGIGDALSIVKKGPKMSKELKNFLEAVIGTGRGKVKDGAKAGKKLNAKELLKKIKKKIKEIIGGKKGSTGGGKSSPDGGKPKKIDKPKGGKGDKLTEPVNDKGGKPKGNYEKSRPGKDGKPITRQNESADLLASEGYDVEMLPETKGGNGFGKTQGSNPDYLINGKAFDCYSPDGSNARNVWATVEKKVEKQAERIVLNLNDYSGSIDDLYNQFKQWNIKDLKELLVIQDGKVMRWIP